MSRERLEYILVVCGLLLAIVIFWYFGNVATALALVVLLAGQLVKSSTTRKRGINPNIQQDLTHELRNMHANLGNNNPEVAVRSFAYIQREGLTEALRLQSRQLVEHLEQLSALLEGERHDESEHELMTSIMREIEQVLAG